jgi:hypothetical protein
MLIRLFIKTTSYDIAKETISNVLSYFKNKVTINQSIEMKPYWKFDNVIVCEINLELSKTLVIEEREEFLSGIATKWLYFGDNEVLTSLTIDGNSLNYNLEMTNIFF